MNRVTRVTATAFATASLVMALGVTLPATGGASSSPALDNPLGLASSGAHVWVANTAGNSVSEFNASNGSLTRTVSLAADDLNSPIALGVNRSNVWIANKAGNSLTELNATSGSLERVVEGASYGF